MPSKLSSKRNRERAVVLIIPLLVFQLALLSFQIQNPTGTTPIKMVALYIEAPIIHLSSIITKGIGDFWDNYIWLVGARAENEQLREVVQELKRSNSYYEQIKKENARLLDLLSIKDSVPYTTIGARVISRTPGFLSNVLYIDRGSRDGVRIDSPVISGDGIIGRTVLVAGNESQVQFRSIRTLPS